MATPTLPRPVPPRVQGPVPPAGSGRPAAPPPDGTPGGGRWPSLDRLRTLLGTIEIFLAACACLGAGVLLATLVVGRTAVFWPSAEWLAVLVLSTGTALLAWGLAAAREPGRPLDRLRAAAWPSLALLPAALGGLAVYRDETSHHFVASYLPTKQTLFAYTLLAFAGGQATYWLSAVSRRRPPGPPGSGEAAPEEGPPAAGTAARAWPAAVAQTPLVLLAIAWAAYLNANVLTPWVPRQTDLGVNLAGARDLVRGILPYHDAIPIWADRVHLLPATLLLLFAPLNALPDGTAHLLFFLGNQILWLVAGWVLVRRLAPAGQEALWWAAVLLFGATYWPWQESIRFGQQDGLLILLFVLSITAAARGREGAAGAALGVALVVKPLSIWLPLVYLVHGRWRALLVAGVTAGLLVLATLPFTGWQPWWHFISVELPAMLPGTVRGTNIPLPSAHARMFVGRESLGDGEPAPTLGIISALNLGANVAGLLLVAHLFLRRPGSTASRRRAWLLDAALGLTLTLLLAPMAWQHYSSWLAVAFFVLALPEVWRPLASGSRLLTASLAGAAFLLLSLEDDHLLHVMTPIVDPWPGALAFYTVGLLLLAVALALARFDVAPDA
jgi:uncharacterized membrane protein YtjA (UPF0391 family)